MRRKAHIFGNNIFVDLYREETSGINFVNASSEFSSLSAEKVLIGGLPVSVFKNPSGKKAIGIHVITSDSSIVDYTSLQYGSFFNYKGTKMYYKTSNGKNILVGNIINDGLTQPEEEISWSGINISLNANREILSHVKVGVPGEVRTASVGGIPMPFARFGSGWYLTVTSDAEVEEEPTAPIPLYGYDAEVVGEINSTIVFDQEMDTSVVPGSEAMILVYSGGFSTFVSSSTQSTWLNSTTLRVVSLAEDEYTYNPFTQQGTPYTGPYSYYFNYAPGTGALRGANGLDVAAFTGLTGSGP